jgi:hypothetical protein
MTQEPKIIDATMQREIEALADATLAAMPRELVAYQECPVCGGVFAIWHPRYAGYPEIGSPLVPDMLLDREGKPHLKPGKSIAEATCLDCGRPLSDLGAIKNNDGFLYTGLLPKHLRISDVLPLPPAPKVTNLARERRKRRK